MSSTTVLREQRLPIAVLLLLVGLFLALLGIFGGATVSHAAQSNPTDTILVKFKTGASDQAIAALNSSNAVTQVDAIPALGIRVLRVPAGKSAATVSATYAKNPLVQFAEVNARVTPDGVPNDPSYGSQWHLPNIGAATAWDSATATGLLVTVCDTGVLGSHPDLVDVLRADLGWNAADGTNDWSPIAGHGTMVAGTIAAATNNAIGVAGVARGAKVIPVRISNFTDGSAYVSDAAKCIQYGADKGAKAINVSYRMAGSSALDTAGAYAKSKGALTFVAAGNDGLDAGWPNYPNFIGVSATDWNNLTASWSNFGLYVDLAAPGVSILTTWSDGTYGGASGTSFASPVAAGVAALVFGANPSLTPDQVQAILYSSADDFGTAGWDPKFGNGRVNAAKAVAAAVGQAPAPADTTPPATSVTSPSAGTTVSGAVSVTASASDNTGVTKVEFYVDGALKATDTASPWSFSWDTTAASNASHSLTARASDAAGNAATSSAVSVTVQNSTPDTTPPSVTLSSPSAAVSVAGSVTVSASATDNVAVAKVEFYVDGALLATDTTSPYDAPWNTSSVANGSHTLTAKAFDVAGNSATSAPVNVDVQNAATLVTDTFTGSVGGRNKPTSITHTVKVNASGPMNLNLTWGAKANLDFAVYNSAGQVVATGTASGTKAEVASFPATAGTYTVVVKTVSGSASYTLTSTHY